MTARLPTPALDTALALERVSSAWDEDILKQLTDYIRIPAKSPGFAPDWREQVKGGLEGLGWSARDADRACDNVAGMVETDPATPVAVLMRAALRSLAK